MAMLKSKEVKAAESKPLYLLSLVMLYFCRGSPKSERKKVNKGRLVILRQIQRQSMHRVKARTITC